MTSPPEERRKAQIDAISNSARLGYRAHTVSPDNAFDRLLAYFDENEPAVAAAIRYGLKPTFWVVRDGDVRGGDYGVGEAEGTEIQHYGIDYPEGHPKQ
jgi:hypothetical protein